jgi:phenylalanyl-tRNA synthetase beta chain
LDGLSRPFAALAPVLVGFVAECARHPNADHLSVCRVDLGDELLDIVCGAPNVAAGQKVALARAGVALPDGTRIKSTVIRGRPSNGMICSEAELGLSSDHEGIMVLDPAARIGAGLPEALDLDDQILDIAVTPNRGDCLSILGLARETAALCRLPLYLPQAAPAEAGPPAELSLSLQVADPALCPLYQGRIIENVLSGKSPAWLRFRLQAMGVRAISNLVDVTNYILLELGQPLHAFDLDKIRGARISVRGADKGEILETLDGQKRELLPSDVTIRDAVSSVALGGIMGGLNSEITSETRRVFLECAIFDPSSIRKTARRLSLSSDASYRFERGVDQTGATYALEKAAAMLADLSGGSVRPGILRVEPRPWKAPALSLRKKKAEDLLGISLDEGFCLDALSALGCTASLAPEQSGAQPGPLWRVSPPGYRPDLTREADLIEELARIYGLDRIEPVVPAIVRPLSRSGLSESAHSFRIRVKHWARGLGLNEVINYSFTSHKELDVFEPSGKGRISILNPLTDEHNVLRTLLAPGLLGALRNNLAQGAAGARFFELATAFSAEAASETTAREEQRLGLLLFGARFDADWPQTQAEADFQDLAGVLNHLLRAFSVPDADLRLADPEAYPWLSPAVDIYAANVRLGFLGRVKADTAADYHAKKPVWLAECNLDQLYSLHLSARVSFTPLPAFPPIRRDITFICAPGVGNAGILEAIAALRLPLLAEVRLIDCFEPQGAQERHLTYRLTFRHPERTLKDAEADRQRDAVAAALPGILAVRL